MYIFAIHLPLENTIGHMQKKWSFADLVTFTEEILMENFIFCAVSDKRLKFLKQFLPLKYHTIWIIITLRSFTKQREYGEIRYLKLVVFY